MKKLFTALGIFYCLPILVFSSLLQDARESFEVEEFIADFKETIENKDLIRYQKAFSKDLQDIEVEKFKNYFEEFSMDSVTVESTSVNKQSLDQSRVYLTLSFQNSYSLILDTWLLDVARVNDRWEIFNKDTLGRTQTLYKLKIPSEKMERVKRVKVEHKDILISFENPVIFYDNIPNLETALIVIGKGEVNFTPSLPREQHHLDLMHNQKSIRSSVDYVYLRFSPTFFKENIRIIKGTSEKKPVDESDIDLAENLFMKNYLRSFTVKSSLTQDFFSVLPQGQEATFEFKVKKLGELTYIFSPFAFEEINLYQWKKKNIICLYSPPLEEKEKRMFISFGQKVDIKNYQIELSYEPKSNHFSARARVAFESNIANLSSVKFKLNPKLKILRANDKKQNKLYFSQDDLRETVYVYLLERLSRGEVGEIDIFYTGKLAPSKEGSESVLPFQQQAKIEFLETRDKSYFYSRSSYWYPAPSEEDYFTARLELTLPQGYTAVSNGKKILEPGSQERDEFQRPDRQGYSVHVFEVMNQIKYLAFIVGRLSVEGEVEKPIYINYYRAPKTLSYYGDIFKTAGEIIDFYQGRFGAYPFDKLSIVRQVGKTQWGNSPPAFVVLNDLPQMSRVSSRRRTRSPVVLWDWDEYFLAHEIAHQWWGHGVSWESYHDHWISEGLAQYATALFLQKKYGEKDFSEILEKFSKWTQKNTEWGAIIMGSRISHLDFEAYQSIIYNKTALVMNMLRDLMGDEMFFLGLQRFFSRHKYSPADTRKFVNIFNELTAFDLDSFFEGWFHSYHLPEVKVSFSVDKHGSGYLLRLSVIQNRDFFMFPLWLEWKENGKRVRKKIVVDKKGVMVEFELENKPKKIKVNPDEAVPGQFKVNKG